MKKNKFVKIACAMLTMCLITTCAISTTLAKYTTGGEAADLARVAHWGVKVTIDGDPMFSNEYENTTNGLTVKSSTADKLVAPGTNSEEVAGALRFAISGTPEVACKVDIDFDFTEDVFMKGKTGLTDWTKATIDNGGTETYQTFNLTDAYYYPVVFTLTQIEDASGTVNNVIATGNLEAIKTALDAYTTGATSTYAPNTNLKAVFELSWAWVIEKGATLEEKAMYDAADTYLGNLIADAASFNRDSLVDGTDYNLEISYSVSITVTQID